MNGLRHLALQLASATLATLLFAPTTQPWLWGAVQASSALLLASLLRLPSWQKLLHFSLAPCALFMLQVDLPPWIYLLALAFTFAIGRNALSERVPLYLSSHEVAEQLALLLPANSRLLEAGAGDGRLALWLAGLRSDLHILALENAWGSFALAYLRWQKQGKPANLRVACRNFWQESWGEHDSIYVFLSPEPMPKVWLKFLKEGQPGSRLISNTFSIPQKPADEVITLDGALQTELLIWHHPHGVR